MTPEPAYLSTNGLTKRYGRVTVVDHCALQFHAGEVHALLGANGAGKSTLVRMIAGLVRASDGEMQVQGAGFEPGNKRDAEVAGIEIVQQELNLIPTLSIAENLLLTRMPARAGVIRRSELHQRAVTALQRIGLGAVAPETLVGSLGVGRQQMVEIAAALDRQCRLLILDEPTAALSAAETKTLFKRLQQLRDEGVAIIYISHRLDEVKELSDRISVLRDGKHLGTFDTNAVSTDDMVDAMSGEQSASVRKELVSRTLPQPALRVENLCGGPIQNVSFTVNKGERFGIAGLVGSGRSELLRLIFGADHARSGSVFLADADIAHRFKHPSQAVDAGIAMVTEDRKANGLLMSQSIRMNTTLAAMQKRFSRFGVVHRHLEETTTTELCDAMHTRCNSIEQTVGTLSGGNQQKVACAKWLVRDANVYLFDEPTRGIDVNARRLIYELLDRLASEGKGIVVVSSDTEELLETCDRIGVMSDGIMVAVFSRESWSREAILQAAFSGYRKEAV